MHAIYKSERFWVGRWRIYLIALLATFKMAAVLAEALPLPGRLDARLRLAPYSADQVYRLYGYVGYEIDLEFAPGEKFVGLGAGDIEGISFVPDRNHLFIKPKAAVVDTNLTILTNLRQYQIEYTASAHRPSPDEEDVMYAVRFTYPPVLSASKVSAERALITQDLRAASHLRPRNYDYWYCGAPSLRPIAAWDDGVLTTLRFGAKAELPAVFVDNADHSESLVNFSIRGGDVVIQRVVQRLILRRGKLTGCIVNRDFSGAGERLTTHTVSPAIERQTIGAHP
jgi:type IV secretion system protein VirB9